MKYLVLLSLFLFFSCKSSKDLGSIQNTFPSHEPIVLNLDYEGETLHAMQRDKIAEAELKVEVPTFEFHPGNLHFSPKAGQAGTLDYYLAERNNPRDLLYSPKPDEPCIYHFLPYDGEEIPAIHLDNSTFDKIRSTKGMITIPKENEKK